MDEILKKMMKISWLIGSNSPRPELSADFLFQVFVRLPIKQLLKCMFVSKFWCSIIRQPTFIQAYYSCNPLLFSIAQHNGKRRDNIYEVFLRQSLYCSNALPSDGQQELFNLFNFSMLDNKRGFCIPGFHGVTQIINGFFCACIANCVSLVNGFTGHITKFPCPHIRPNALAHCYFRFEPITGLYKLRIDSSNSGQRWEQCRQWLPTEATFRNFYMLTISGSDQEFSWRRLRLPEEVPQSISVNGTLYWIYRRGYSICCFNLTREKFVYLYDANVRLILRRGADICRKPCLEQFKGKLSLFYCKGRDMIIPSLETDYSWTVHKATLPDEFQNAALIRVSSLSIGQILLEYTEIKYSNHSCSCR